MAQEVLAPMHNDDIRLRVWTPGSEAETIERSILMQTLALHPAQLTILELAMRVDRDWADFAQRDAVEVAVRELSRDGLLTCDSRRITPSRPILRFEQLLGGGI
jgi:tRNA splicing endonuclease